jgi:hypothetical protein
MITNQKELRRAFWESHPNVRRGTSANGDYVTDTRVAFVEYVDALARDGVITEELAQRVTL